MCASGTTGGATALLLPPLLRDMPLFSLQVAVAVVVVPVAPLGALALSSILNRCCRQETLHPKDADRALP